MDKFVIGMIQKDATHMIQVNVLHSKLNNNVIKMIVFGKNLSAENLFAVSRLKNLIALILEETH
jgi:hypothetical protein